MASVQFNLLPDVKLEYIKTQRSKALIITVATIAAVAAVAIFLLVFLTVEGVQRKQLSDSDKDIAAASKQLKDMAGLSQILTVQNQLNTISSLHHQNMVTSRIFKYLPQVTPVNVHLGSVALDFAANSLSVSGTADSQATVNTYIDTLKFTTFKVDSTASASPAFTSVVESSFGITQGTVNYTITMNFDPQLFSNTVTTPPQLNVPKLTTTRSVLEDPSNALFNGSPTSGGQ